MYVENFTAKLMAQLATIWDKLIHSLPGIALAIFVLVLGILISQFIMNFAQRRITHKAKDPLLISFIGRLSQWVIIFIALALALRATGLSGIAGSLVAGAGITAFIIGFAFQNIGANFLSGIVLAFKRPFDIGDIIQSQGIKGTVLNVDLRATHVRTIEETDVFIPNSGLLNNPLYNFTREGCVRSSFTISVSYKAEFEEVNALISKTLQQIEGISVEKPSAVTILQVNNTSLNLEVYYWMDVLNFNSQYLYFKGMVQNKTKEALLKAGMTLS